MLSLDTWRRLDNDCFRLRIAFAADERDMPVCIFLSAYSAVCRLSVVGLWTEGNNESRYGDRLTFVRFDNIQFIRIPVIPSS
jgi:hypothetical protein